MKERTDVTMSSEMGIWNSGAVCPLKILNMRIRRLIRNTAIRRENSIFDFWINV
jgi:hypothetical protein